MAVELLHPREGEVVEDEQEMLVPLQLHETIVEPRLNCRVRLADIDWIDMQSFYLGQLVLLVLADVDGHELDAEVHGAQVVGVVDDGLEDGKLLPHVLITDGYFECLSKRAKVAVPVAEAQLQVLPQADFSGADQENVDLIYFFEEGVDPFEVVLLPEDAGLLEEDDERGGRTSAQQQRAEWASSYTLMVWMSSVSFLKRRLVMMVKMLVFLVWMMDSFLTMMMAGLQDKYQR